MSSRIILANVVVRLRTFSRQKYAMFFTFAFPVILILVFGVIFIMPERVPMELHVQDLDRTPTSAQLIEGFTADRVFTVQHVPPGADAVEHAQEHGRALVLVIPQGFELSHSRDQVEPGAVEPVAGGPVAGGPVAGGPVAGGPVAGGPVRLQFICAPDVVALPDQEQFLHLMLLEVNQRLFEQLPFISPGEAAELRRGNRFLDFFVPGILAMAVMTASLYGALHINAELRQKGIIRKLAATPITRVEWLFSNVLYQLVLAAISAALILIVSSIAFGVMLRVNLWLPLFIVLAVVTFVGLGMLLTPIAKDAESASAAGNAILFPMMFLSGTFFPTEMMPGVLQFIAYVLPLYYINEGLRAAMVFADQGAALQYGAVSAAFAAALFVGGAMATKWDEST